MNDIGLTVFKDIDLLKKSEKEIMRLEEEMDGMKEEFK
jgi:hypothetical protein